MALVGGRRQRTGREREEERVLGVEKKEKDFGSQHHDIITAFAHVCITNHQWTDLVIFGIAAVAVVYYQCKRRGAFGLVRIG